MPETFVFYINNVGVFQKLGLIGKADLSLEIEEFEKKYAGIGHFEATNQIIDDHKLPIKKNSILFDALLFRVRLHQQAQTPASRESIF